MSMKLHKPEQTVNWSTRELGALIGKDVSVALHSMGEPPMVGRVSDAGIGRFGQAWVQFEDGRSVEWNRADIAATVIVEDQPVTDLRSDLARFIGQADRGNELSGYQLGTEIAVYLRGQGLVTDEATESAIEDFTADANAGVGYCHPKRLTGSALAGAIVDHFKLDEGR